ncbi:hypothetical protein [Leclercia adecarboxylata]|uniref:hypothetical protein n=1 Tax=Leclercia adecarboxylata TaxID=83655 RepID=UPI0013D1B61E|nr:hypothetical protein [Leclercia adecarboxylata]
MQYNIQKAVQSILEATSPIALVKVFDAITALPVANTPAPESVPEDELDHGRVSYVATVKGASVRTAFKLVEANALIPSNGLDGKLNGAYPQELQPRDRTRVSSVMQITKLSRSLQPARLADSGLSSHGAPIIGPDRVVESGNGRTMAIIKAYVEGNAGEYRQYLEDNAELYGFTTAQVKSFSSPVLVRVRLDEVDRVQFTKDSNVSDMQAMSPTEQARIDAEAMDDGVMSLFAPGSSGDLLAASNRPFVSAFLAKLTGEQAAGLLTADGRPTRQVIDRIRGAMFARAYQNDSLLQLAIEEPDPEIRNVLTALTTAAPQFVQMRALSGEAHKQTTDALAESVDMNRTLDEEALSALVEATTIVREARNNGQTVPEYLAQGDMFGDRDPQAAALATFIAANNRSTKRMAEAFTLMADEICQVLAHKGSAVADMFGAPPVDLVSVLARVSDHMAEAYGEKAGIQVGMFDSFDYARQALLLDVTSRILRATSIPGLLDMFDAVTTLDNDERQAKTRALIGEVISRFHAVTDIEALAVALKDLNAILSLASDITRKARAEPWETFPVNVWFGGKAEDGSWINRLRPAAKLVLLAMTAAEDKATKPADLSERLASLESDFEGTLKGTSYPPTDALLSWITGKPTTTDTLRASFVSERTQQFGHDAKEFEQQIRALGIHEKADKDATSRFIQQNMTREKVRALVDADPNYEALTDAQRDSIAAHVARAAMEIPDGSKDITKPVYTALTTFAEQQRSQPNRSASYQAANQLYQSLRKQLLATQKPTLVGTESLRKMIDQLVEGVMPDSEAAAMGAKTKIRIKSASLARGYELPAMKADMNRFYQIVSGQTATPELVRTAKRAHASRKDNHINSGEGMTKTTLWHEMGHFVEYQHPELLAAAKALLKRRMDAIPEKLGKIAYLKNMTGSKSYGKEVAINDGFYNPYVGKVYGELGIEGTTATEVFSMGFQALATDAEMARLAMKDPEHLSLVMAAIKMLGIKYKESR